MVLIYTFVITNEIVFLMFIGHLDIPFCEMSVEILCSFFHLVIIDLVFTSAVTFLVNFYYLFSTITSFIHLILFLFLLVSYLRLPYS